MIATLAVAVRRLNAAWSPDRAGLARPWVPTGASGLFIGQGPSLINDRPWPGQSSIPVRSRSQPECPASGLDARFLAADLCYVARGPRALRRGCRVREHRCDIEAKVTALRYQPPNARPRAASSTSGPHLSGRSRIELFVGGAIPLEHLPDSPVVFEMRTVGRQDRVGDGR